ncbi:MAG: helix-turn-helix domain-containing protein [Parcubacteria group bacterium]|jgi:sugar-specific transcriptional regulator TrmB
MNINKALALFNLDEKESAVYLTALELGEATAREITKKAGIQRTYFYDLSEKLFQLGLLQQIRKSKKRYFRAAEPEKLLKMQEERLQELKSALPELKAIQNTKGQKPKVYFFEGRTGIDQVNEDTLRYKDEILGFTTPRFVSAFGEKLSQEYIAKRKSLEIKVRVIGEVSPEVAKIKSCDKAELRETRMLPKDLFSSEVEIGMYGNKVFFANYKEQFGLIIEDSEISKTLKQIFEIIWKGGFVIE